jgi:hypothetical protein
MQNLKLLAALIVFSLSTGCATVMRGEQQKVEFVTDPGGATVNVDKKDYTAPATVTLKRNQPHTITVSHPGYQAIQFDLKSQWDGASLPDLAFPGGSVLFGIDTLNGSDRKFNTLAKIKLNPSNGSTTMPAAMKEWRGKLVTPAEYERLYQADRNDQHRFFKAE